MKFDMLRVADAVLDTEVVTTEGVEAVSDGAVTTGGIFEISTENVIDSISESIETVKNTDPSVIQQYFTTLGKKVLGLGLQTVLAIVVFFLGRRLIGFVRKVLRKTLNARDADLGLTQFLDSLANIGLHAALLLIILGIFGVTASSIATLIGAAGLAIGLALQGSLSNFAGGVLILVLRPFKVGDYIIEDNHKQEGTVTEISIFYTKLLTVDNKVVVIPNGALSDTSITNVTGSHKRRLIIQVGVSYDADLQAAKAILERLFDQDPDRIGGEPWEVYVDALGESSVVLAARMWVNTDNYWPCRWRLLEQVKREFEASGIEIPYNKLDVNIRKG